MSALFVADQRVKLSGRYVWIMRLMLGKTCVMFIRLSKLIEINPANFEELWYLKFSFSCNVTK